MTDIKLMRNVWIILMALTLSSAMIAESAEPAVWVILLVSLMVGIKGQLVVDYLMGLRHANRKIRMLMLSYFYFFPSFVALGIIFSDQIRLLTTI